MANKTQPEAGDVEAFIAGIADDRRRADAEAVHQVMLRATRRPAQMWGTSIVGYGEYEYVTKSGSQERSLLVGWSPRKTAMTLYLGGAQDDLPDDLAALGRTTAGKGCLYVKTFEGADLAALRRIVAHAYRVAKERHGGR